MKSFEVIIVGAGPGGLNCAKVLAESNKRVLLLEKNSEIGPKVCAGGLTGHDIDYLNLPDDLLDHKYKELTLHTPLNKDIVRLKEYFVYTIDRKNLGQWQLKSLKKNNIEIRVKSQVTEIGKDYVILDNSEKIRFKFLVGADGSTSIVRKYLGLKINKIIFAAQYVIPKKGFNKFEIYYDSDLFGAGYAWIFPHKNYVSIGCGNDPKFLPSKKLIQNFKRWLIKEKIDISKGEFQAKTLNYDYQGYKFNNIFLVGDAAGLVSGFTGEGIYQALISGEEVAKLIINERYKPEKMRELLKIKEIHNKITNFLQKTYSIRKIEYEVIALLLKNKFMEKKLIDIIT